MPPALSANDEQLSGLREALSDSEVALLGQVLGQDPSAQKKMTPKEIWEWVKKKLREPGKKLPRPGHGLPSLSSIELLLLAVGAYLLTRGSRGREADYARYALVAVVVYLWVTKAK